jgi:plastocyanin
LALGSAGGLLGLGKDWRARASWLIEGCHVTLCGCHVALDQEGSSYRKAGQVVKLRKWQLSFIVLLGAVLGVVPALALTGSEPSVEAVNEGIYYHHWAPAEVAATPAQAVTFKNTTNVMHGIVWETANNPGTPTCGGTVPVGVGHSGTNWSGTCTFPAEGAYKFYCSVHGREMSGTVYINSQGTIPTVTMTMTMTSSSSSTLSSTSSTFSSTTATTTPIATSTTTTLATTSTPPPGATQATTANAPPAGGLTLTTAHTTTSPRPEGSSSPTLVLAKGQHGGTVHGAIEVSPADQGARLEVQLLATTASLARAKHAAAVRVGRFVRASVTAGRVSFSIALNAKAKATLRKHKRLPVLVRIVLTPAYGAPSITTHSVVLRG